LQESTGATPEQAASFVECLKRRNPDADLQISNGVIIPRQTVGELSDNWQREQGLKLTLEPRPGAEDDNKVLQNLSIGPAAGRKSAVIRSWCTSLAQACVDCDPKDVSDSANEIIVRLKTPAPVDKRQMAGKYPIAPANDHKPWEDVNEKGERFYYECRAK
jgi:hypothetical protein